MTCHFVLPFSVWLWRDEVTMQVLWRQKEENIRPPNDEWKSYLKTWHWWNSQTFQGYCPWAPQGGFYSTPYDPPAARGQCADARWVMTFMKNGGHQKPWWPYMTTFGPPSINHFSLSLNSKKTCGKEIHEKETKPIHPSAADLLHTGIGNINWCKCGHCKNKVREIDCLSCREVWRSYTQELPRTLSFDPKPNPNPHSCNTLF